MDDVKKIEEIRKDCLQIRLEKEADEESWISGEELRTDGSSEDERRTAKAVRRKPKKRRTSTDKAFSQNIEGANAGEMRLEVPVVIPKFDEFRFKRRSQSLTESLDLDTKWRPKRGSLKLPTLSDNLWIEKKMKYSTENIEKLWKSIQNLDKQIEEQNEIYQTELREYDKTEEVCTTLMNVGKHLESESESETDLKYSTKKINGKNFIRRNIELAKTIPMATNIAITDEEKEKLHNLLDDLDENYDEINAFSLTAEDQERLINIDAELDKFKGEIDKNVDTCKCDLELEENK